MSQSLSVRTKPMPASLLLETCSNDTRRTTNGVHYHVEGLVLVLCAEVLFGVVHCLIGAQLLRSTGEP